MKTKLLIMWGLCFLLVGISAAILFFTEYMVYDTILMPMDVKVSQNIGFNLDTDQLHFGGTQTPGSAYRKITVENKYSQPLRVTLIPEGPLGSWVSAEDFEPIFNPGERRNITMNLAVPSGVPYGDYNGTIRIIFTRVLI